MSKSDLSSDLGQIRPRHVPVVSQSPRRLASLLGDQAVEAAEARALQLRERLQARVLWNINSTERGGGVAEILQCLLPYVRGMGIDNRWMVIDGTPEFFRMTKRLHHALHGSEGDGSPLDENAREIYEAVLQANSDELLSVIRPDDIVVLHDPQTAGLIGALKNHGAHVVWRCHVGTEARDDPQSELAWGFLSPYVVESDVNVFSHPAYIPECCDHGRSVVIRPSIDPFSPKNQELDLDTAHSILAQAGVVGDGVSDAVPMFTRFDGSPGRVDRLADVTQLGPPPPEEVPLIVQISRWDPLKDPIGVIDGFAEYLRDADGEHPHLVMAGPNVTAIPDDPEGIETLDKVLDHWRDLPHAVRARVHIVCLPMADIEENAAIVNALQRHAAIIVQKSLHEGFGLTVTEAMWKGRPIVASAVGGIVDQIQDGENGLLLSDPADPVEFASAIKRLMDDPKLARELGENAKETARMNFLPIRHLLDYANLLDQLNF
jgi:trehalose synthase